MAQSLLFCALLGGPARQKAAVYDGLAALLELGSIEDHPPTPPQLTSSLLPPLQFSLLAEGALFST